MSGGQETPVYYIRDSDGCCSWFSFFSFPVVHTHVCVCVHFFAWDGMSCQMAIPKNKSAALVERAISGQAFYDTSIRASVLD